MLLKTVVFKFFARFVLFSLIDFLFKMNDIIGQNRNYNPHKSVIRVLLCSHVTCNGLLLLSEDVVISKFHECIQELHIRWFDHETSTMNQFYETGVGTFQNMTVKIKISLLLYCYKKKTYRISYCTPTPTFICMLCYSSCMLVFSQKKSLI